MPTPLLYRGLYYVVHHNGRLVAYDAESGAPIYKCRFSRGGVFTASPVAVNGKLYLPTEEGHVYVLEAGPEFLRTPSRLVAVAKGSWESGLAGDTGV